MSSKKTILKNLKNDMILFGKVIMPNMFVAESPDFHYTIGDALVDKKEKQINIIAPRGHAKSSIVGGVFPLHHIFFDSMNPLFLL